MALLKDIDNIATSVRVWLYGKEDAFTKPVLLISALNLLYFIVILLVGFHYAIPVIFNNLEEASKLNGLVSSKELSSVSVRWFSIIIYIICQFCFYLFAHAVMDCFSKYKTTFWQVATNITIAFFFFLVLGTIHTWTFKQKIKQNKQSDKEIVKQYEPTSLQLLSWKQAIQSKRTRIKQLDSLTSVNKSLQAEIKSTKKFEIIANEIERQDTDRKILEGEVKELQQNISDFVAEKKEESATNKEITNMLSSFFGYGSEGLCVILIIFKTILGLHERQLSNDKFAGVNAVKEKVRQAGKQIKQASKQHKQLESKQQANKQVNKQASKIVYTAQDFHNYLLSLNLDENSWTWGFCEELAEAATRGKGYKKIADNTDFTAESVRQRVNKFKEWCNTGK